MKRTVVPNVARAALALLLLSFAGLLAACGGGRVGWGVMLWSADETVVKSGTVVDVRSTSTIDQSDRIRIAAGAPAVVSVDSWRVELFSDRAKAVTFAASYAPFAAMTGRASAPGIAIRQKASTDSQRIYRLRGDEVVKILGEAKSQESGDGGQWYAVLAEDGTRGYCSAGELAVAGPGGTFVSGATGAGSSIDQVLAQVYRPDYYEKMVTDAHYDLSRFSLSYGLFPDATGETVKVVTTDETETFHYDSIDPLADGEYSFHGTSLVLGIEDHGDLRVQYTDENGKTFDDRYVPLSDDEVQTRITAETKRREELFRPMLAMSPLSSDYYGSITFGADGSFTWEGIARLVPDIIPADAGSTGHVDFGLYLGTTVAADYKGVVTFQFAGEGVMRPVSFLFTYEGGGLRLTSLPQGTLDDLVVTAAPASPFNVFFHGPS